VMSEASGGGEFGGIGMSLGAVEGAEEGDPEDGEFAFVGGGENAGEFFSADEIGGKEVGGDEEDGGAGVVDSGQYCVVPMVVGAKGLVVEVVDAVVTDVGFEELFEDGEPFGVFVGIRDEDAVAGH